MNSRRLPVDDAGVNGRGWAVAVEGVVEVFVIEGLEEGSETALSETDGGGLDGLMVGVSLAVDESESLEPIADICDASGRRSDSSSWRAPSSELFDQPEREAERGDGGTMVTMGWTLGVGEGLRDACSVLASLPPRSSDCLLALFTTMLGTAVAVVVVGAAILLRAGDGVRPRRRESNDRREFSRL